MSIRTTIAAGLAAALAISGAQAASAGAQDIADLLPVHSEEITAEELAAEPETAALAEELLDELDKQTEADRGALSDRDGDGIPDVWEEEGVVLLDGTELPLHEWGADPDRKDLFLQLNWMKSEFETLKCGEAGANAAACAKANTKTYRPTPQILEQLVDLFAKHDIALHIDAGATYTNIDNYPVFHGGETEAYEQYYFNNTKESVKLGANQERLLGERDNIFRVGVIGDQMNQRNYSSGAGIVGGNSFYVANNVQMRTQDQLRNTILHELGHNLGLRHNGHDDYVQGLDNNRMHPDYKSVMNYNYQWTRFDYSTEAYTRTDAGENRDVPADWDVIELGNATIGKRAARTGASVDQDKVAAANAEKERLADAVAKAGTVEMAVTADNNDPVKPGEKVVLTVKLTNPGIDLNAYTVDVSYPGGNAKETIALEGAFSGRNTVEFTIELTAVEMAEMPVDIAITAGRQQVAQETFTVNVEKSKGLAYEGTSIKTEAPANNAPAKDAQSTNAQSNAKIDTANNAVKVPAPSAEKDINIAAIVAPIVIALIAAIGGAAFMMMNGK